MGLMRSAREVLRYQEMLRNMVRRDLVVRYQRSIVGILLSLAVPLLATTVFSLLFAGLVPGRDHREYPFYAFIGFIAWDYFARSLSIATEVLRGHGDLIGKVYFPLEVLPLTTCLSVLVQFLLGLGLFTAVNGLTGTGLHWTMLLLPPFVLALWVLVAGFAFLVATAGVRFRDFPQLLIVLLTIWFYATPVFYSPQFVEQDLVRVALQLNPLTHVVNVLRALALDGRVPEPGSLAYMLAWSVGAFVIGHRVFDLQRRVVIEEL